MWLLSGSDALNRVVAFSDVLSGVEGPSDEGPSDPADGPSGVPMCGDTRGALCGGVLSDVMLPNGVLSEEQSLNGVPGLSRLVRFVFDVGGV